MAQNQLRPANRINFVAKTRAVANSAAVSTDSLVTPGNFTDMTALDTRLTAIDSTAYSPANLNTMTLNDKIYALRVADAAAETGAIL